MNNLLMMALMAGAALGLAGALLVWQLMPARPALGPAMQRLNPGGQLRYEHPARRAARLLLERLVPESDLAVRERTRKHYLGGMGASAFIGLAIPLVLGWALGLMGWQLPFVIPAAAGIACAAGAVLLVYRDVRTRADKTRREYRRGVAIYLDQIALQVAAGHSPQSSLTRAAQIGHGGVFNQIRDALTDDSGHRNPWDELRALGERLRVPALGDLGEIVAASGSQGAHIYHTLRAKTSSLRDEIRFDDLGEAKKGSTALDAIGAGVVMILLLIVIYPFISRLNMG